MEVMYEGQYYDTVDNKAVCELIDTNCKDLESFEGKLVELRVIDIEGTEGDIICTTPNNTRVRIPLEDFSAQDVSYAGKIRYIGRYIMLYIIGFNEETNEYIGSRRAVQEEFIETICSKWVVKETIITAKTTYVGDTRVYVDLGYGVTTCIIRQVASCIVTNTMRDMYNPDEFVMLVLIKPISDKNRFYIAQKPLMGDWQSNINMLNLKTDSYVEGVVISVQNYGVFVALNANLVGLAEYRSDIAAGMTVRARVREIYPAKEKIKLVIESVCEKPNTKVLHNNLYDIKGYNDFLATGSDVWMFGSTYKDTRDIVFHSVAD